MKTKFILLFFSLSFSFSLIAQDSVVFNGFQVFKYPNGVISSQGTMRNGKPDGYWKTYYETGVLKSEGNRKNYELDSLWKFYDNNGSIKTSITYQLGSITGPRTTYFGDYYVVDMMVNNVKHGISNQYFPDGKLQKSTYFIDGLEDGYQISYASDGRIIELVFYQKGFQKNREIINRLDENNMKYGLWKEFWPGNDFTVKSEINYRKDLIDGYAKYYDEQGNLKSIQKYVNGILVIDPPELAEYELRTDYYSDGSIKTVGSYRDGIAEGVRRDYAPDGKIVQSYILTQGRIIGQGIIDENGQRQGAWKLYFLSGRLQAEGIYKDNVKIGQWKYYFENGNLEQIGSYDNKGFTKGEWIWYYPNKSLRRVESFYEDIAQGDMIEYAADSSIMLQGTYVDGRKEGHWIENIHGFKSEGDYLDDVREGFWISHYPNGNKYSEGKYVDDFPDGTHINYFDNGNIMSKGAYSMGLKNGEWRYFNEDGKLFLVVEFNQGIEIRYDTKKIEPELSPSELSE